MFGFAIGFMVDLYRSIFSSFFYELWTDQRQLRKEHFANLVKLRVRYDFQQAASIVFAV